MARIYSRDPRRADPLGPAVAARPRARGGVGGRGGPRRPRERAAATLGDQDVADGDGQHADGQAGYELAGRVERVATSRRR